MRRGPRPGPLALMALVVIVIVGGIAVLFSNPRHRGLSLKERATAEALRDARARARFGFPGLARGDDVTDPSGVSPLAAVSPGHRVPLVGTDERIHVPVADRIPARFPAEGVPDGWTLKEFTGRAAVELVREDGAVAIRLRSMQASFALYRDVIVDLREYPILTWRWKVVSLPAAGDVRAASTDDQAAQVYVVFPRWPAPLAHSDVIGYVWDSRAPVGLQVESPKAANVRIIVVESGRGRLDTWQRQERDVARDYATLFGRQPPRVGQVAVMIDSNDTGADAEALFRGLAFEKAPRGTR